MKLKQSQNIFLVIVTANSIAQNVIQIKNEIKNISMWILKNIIIAKIVIAGILAHVFS